MKKNYILYTCAAAALMFASCQKETPAAQNTPVAPGSMDVITATTVQTKTMTQDGVNVLWEKGDGVVLACQPDPAQQPVMCSYTTTLTQPNSTALFVKDAGQQNQPTLINDKYVAVYPAALNYSLWSKNGYVTLAADKDQVVENGGWDPNSALMLAVSENSEFTFKHVVSYIKFQVDANTTPFNKVLVSSLDSSQEIISRISVYFNGDEQTFTRGKSQCSKVVSFTNSNNSTFVPGTYYIVVNPDTYADGLKITFENGSNACDITTPANITLAPGDVADLGTIGTLQLGAAEKLELATVFEENGKKQGVVYWIDPANPAKGKIVSISTASTIMWGAANTNLGGTNTNDALANYAQITGLDKYKEDANNFPAIKYCADLRTSHGGNWYLPVSSDLQSIYNTYYGLSNSSWTNNTDYRLDANGAVDTEKIEAKKVFDAALKLLGDTIGTMDGDANNDGVSDNAGFGTANGVTYWTSKENSTDGKIHYVRFGKYTLSSTTKMNANQAFVRCIRDVEL